MDSSLKNTKSYLIDGKFFSEIISPSSIKSRVHQIGEDISREFKSEKPVIIGVLNGAFIFMSDLIRNIDIEFEVDFIKISSYKNDLKSSGTINLEKNINIDVTNKHVIIVEDIVDTGLSLKYLYGEISKLSPSSIRFATLLYKNNKNNVHRNKIHLDWIGFNVEDYFVIGYGLDYKQYYRGLNGIYAAKER